MKSHLEGTGKFTPHETMAHRLFFSDGTPLDLLPFEGVADQQAILRWPPELAIKLNVAGFNEALANAVTVKLSESLAVPVASMPGLALLKLFAWVDRRHSNSKDAADLLELMRRYGDAGNLDRLYGEHQDMFVAAGYDIEHAGSKLLGSDVRALLAPEMHTKVIETLSVPGIQDALVTSVASSITWSDSTRRLETAGILVGAFLDGLQTRKFRQ